MLFCWMLLACGLEPMESDPTSSESNEDVDRGGPVDNIVYPGPEDVGVLIYHGHGGQPLSATAMLSETLEADGWDFSRTSDFPLSFDGIRLVVLSNPGLLGGAPAVFTEDEVSLIQTAMSRGTRFLIGMEPENCASSSAYELLEALDSPVIFDGNNMAPTSSVTLGTLDEEAQPMAGVSKLSFKGPCYITEGAGWMVKNGSNQVIAARYQPGNAGDVVMVGDLDFLLDNGIESADNEQFVRNLAQVQP